MQENIWQTKIDSIPLPENSDQAWEDMEALLNTHYPVTEPVRTGGVLKIVMTKLFSMLGYVLPAAAMVTVGTYMIIPTKDNEKTLPLPSQMSKKRKVDLPVKKDTNLKKDSLIRANENSKSILIDTIPQNKIPSMRIRSGKIQHLQEEVLNEKETDSSVQEIISRYRKSAPNNVRSTENTEVKSNNRARKRN
ncbi:hypothetical protein [Pedobacter montanisoli]|uniref:Uncharacterized protein n=1 Tax=Pedobacter montanisoli TaxID=2923277 RepID=A0ABS9ZVL0_9SPHI|nr:hypothetical protein [Pedobacter montanisoli]MCJ0742214.1 hypothetical protein [Pedobacter montanisoli]